MQNLKGKSVFNWNLSIIIEKWWDVVNHTYMHHICAKGSLDLNINKAVINKISNFQEIAQNIT